MAYVTGALRLIWAAPAYLAAWVLFSFGIVLVTVGMLVGVAGAWLHPRMQDDLEDLEA